MREPDAAGIVGRCYRRNGDLKLFVNLARMLNASK
jgi:hypothetical protein